MRCNCESTLCPHHNRDGETYSCHLEAEGTFRMAFVGAVCAACATHTAQTRPDLIERAPFPSVTVELTEREAAMIDASAELNAASMSQLAQQLRGIPALSLGVAQEAARWISIRDKIRAAVPGLAENGG